MPRWLLFFLRAMTVNRDAQFYKDLHTLETIKKKKRKRNHLRRVK
ncbi:MULTISPECIES: hypothetical protein [Laceyella]|uniref:Uncharacterized protein n=3 Tax=Laceyella TaxID=292635 RepID=A0AA46AH56_9BACL|nr:MULTISPECIES: hypothetical protein [Laceyella]PRZ11812.1 hypothetical protein CLV36_12118 [Laceyella sediminis]TCW34977.1 hypothetical protein EDC32_11018 [Laceyella sacchari]UWE02505.1 hypothetical protein NYR52_09995 [Laceyella sacchari]SMP36034.1 hypothetical protein SAMN06265361_1156 [Laceyella tengchongensis]